MKTHYNVGTSGWLYKDWRGKFYPSELSQKNWFPYYADHFNSVEINNTFYQMPKVSTLEAWAEASPDNFKYVIKLNRYLTHLKRLKLDEASTERLQQFIQAISPLGSKLALVLAQLPPNLACDNKRLDALLKTTSKYAKVTRTQFQIAVEFRHASWFNDETFAVLRQHNAANVINSSPDAWPASKAVTADFAYFRFHGSKKLYGSSYNDDELKSWAKFIRDDCARCKHVYAYFNNDQQAYAPKNASRLLRLLQQV
jgi:uncharacterized protein YecE (DUF72 family)